MARSPRAEWVPPGPPPLCVAPPEPHGVGGRVFISWQSACPLGTSLGVGGSVSRAAGWGREEWTRRSPFPSPRGRIVGLRLQPVARVVRPQPQTATLSQLWRPDVQGQGWSPVRPLFPARRRLPAPRILAWPVPAHKERAPLGVPPLPGTPVLSAQGPSLSTSFNLNYP